MEYTFIIFLLGPRSGPGSEGSKGCGKRFLGLTGLTAGGFLSLTALWAEGCGIARRAMSLKSALRDWPFCVIWHDEHYGNQPPPVAFPPLVAGATKGGLHFLARRAVVWFYINWRLLSIHRRPTTTLAPKGETTHYDLCVALLLQIMFAVHARGASNLSPLRTFGPAGRQPSSPSGLVHIKNLPRRAGFYFIPEYPAVRQHLFCRSECLCH